MTKRSGPSVAPCGDDAELARDALLRVQKILAENDHDRSTVTVRVEGEAEPVTLPRAAMELLTRVLGTMAAGRAVTVVPAHAELTTQQAADMLNVSRPFLIGLLESGEIEYRKVGTHRRVKMESLLTYRRSDDVQRREAADDLTRLTQDMGLL